jgi:hypothetical protein
MTQSLLFDPTDEGTGVQLNVWTGAYGVTAMSFPAPPLETAMAGSIDTEGDLIAARRHQNRTVNLTVEVRGTTAASLASALATLEEKVAKVAREGGTLRRVTTTGDYRTLDLLAADSYDPTFDVARVNGNWVTAQIGLLARPYARGTEAQIATTDASGFGGTTGLGGFTPVPTAGEVPGLARINVSDTNVGGATRNSSIGWATVTYGIQGEHYDSAATAALFYEAESLQPVSPAAAATVAGASGGSVVQGSLGASASLSVDNVMLVPVSDGSGTAGDPYAGSFSDFALRSNSETEFRSDGVRYSVAGSGLWASLMSDGDLPTVPPQTIVRVLVRPVTGGIVGPSTPSGDEALYRDNVAWDATVDVFETPRYLTMP